MLFSMMAAPSAFPPAVENLDSSNFFTGRTDTEVEAPVLWPPDAKSRSGQDPDAGTDGGRRRRGPQRMRRLHGVTNLTDMSWSSSGRY